MRQPHQPRRRGVADAGPTEAEPTSQHIASVFAPGAPPGAVAASVYSTRCREITAKSTLLSEIWKS